MIQAPQDHRDGDRTVMHHAMNGEYAGFFDIGMVQRNEANAIITHGTMCLIRRAALDDAGGWSSDTICEDTDLGLTLLERGWHIHYTNRRYGHGLLPDTFEAFKKQRYRWAYGGLQILKKHWRSLLAPQPATHPRSEARVRSRLAQLAGRGIDRRRRGDPQSALAAGDRALSTSPIPDKILTVPILASFAVAIVHFVVLYRLRVTIPLGQTITAVFAAMSVQWTVARAVACGLCTESLPFLRTAKGGATRKGPDFAAFWEGVMVALLMDRRRASWS